MELSSSEMKVVFVDTNFWLIFYLQGIDIISELKRIVPERFKIITSNGVINELKKIKKNSLGKTGTAAKIALKLIKKSKVEIIKDYEIVDDFIEKLAQNNKNLVVCTNDKELREKLKKLGIQVVVMRGKNKLDFL